MPSDKAAICTPTQITPAPGACTIHRDNHYFIRLYAPGKDRVDLKKQKGSRSYATPTAFNFFNIKNSCWTLISQPSQQRHLFSHIVSLSDRILSILIDSGKIPSDKAAIYTPSQIPPAPWACSIHRDNYYCIHLCTPGKDRVDF